MSISGCRRKPIVHHDADISQVNFDTTIDQYICLSTEGLDYCIPDLNKDIWNEWQILEGESRYAERKNGKVVFYLLRQMDVGNVYGFTNVLGNEEMVELLRPQILKYIGDLKIKKETIHITEGIKYYDLKGEVGDSYYYASFFQSDCLIPSVSMKYIPTVYVVVYDEKGFEKDVINMINDIKEWTIECNY